MNKKKILLISDDIRSGSGVGNISKELILGTAYKYDWVQLSTAIKHPQEGSILNVSKAVDVEAGIEGSNVELVPCSNKTSTDLKFVVNAIDLKKPDLILLFGDPHLFRDLLKSNKVIREKAPIAYLNIWDNLPIPRFNKTVYESVDVLLPISRLTEYINKEVLKEVPEKPGIHYLPHGRSTKSFFKIRERDDKFKTLQSFRKALLEGQEKDFVVFSNVRNIVRKEVGVAMEGFLRFCKQIEGTEKDVLYVIHTSPLDPQGPDLYAVRDILEQEYGVYGKVKFSAELVQEDTLNLLYNVADVVLQTSSNEGWGLSLTESLLTGTPFIATATGGMLDQMNIPVTGKLIKGEFTKHGEWCVPLLPESYRIVGSNQTPYIYESLITLTQISQKLQTYFLLDKKRREEDGLKGLKWVSEKTNGYTSENMCNRFVEVVEEELNKLQESKISGL